LSGLVAGCAVGATSGAVVVAVADQAGSAPFTCLVGSILLLRSRTYVDGDRRIAIVAGGLATLTACLYIVVNTHREGVGPIACALVVIGLIAVRRPNSGATVSRMLDRLEYAASAAVIPVACWVGGAYTAVGGFGPP
jgi:hypothetical protein